MREEEYVFLGMVLPSETPAVDHVTTPVGAVGIGLLSGGFE